ncbi:MAG: IS481 family transposase [Actinomycetota bacterium]|nr:MAG: IS481 family transposase [Actinomycetota bacterium]
MSIARLVITAVVVQGRSQAEVARTYKVSKGWVSKLVARYCAEGEAAFEPRSRRPARSPTATPETVVELVLEHRKSRVAGGLDAGPATLVWILEHHHHIRVSAATIWRILRRAGAVDPQPHKRPRSSYIRFQADQPNECWQADFTHVRLADGTDVEVLTFLDDHSRYLISVTAHRRVTGPIVVAAFRQACATHGIPASTLTDNGMVFTTRLSGGRGGRNGFETELRHLGVTQKNSRPNHPGTCGKVERVQQTMKLWLTARPPATTIDELQQLCDRFVDVYNHQRPHRSLPGHSTPAVAYATRPKATPGTRDDDRHHRVRRDTVDQAGRVTLRHHGRLHHIGLSRTLARTRVLLLIDDLDIRVIDAATGELYRHLTLDPTRDYQPFNDRDPRPTRKTTQSEPQ